MFKRIRLFEVVVSEALAIAVLAAGAIGGATVFLYEAYNWIRTGTWELHTLVTLLQSQGDRWATNPQDWIGLHQTLSVIPMFAILPLIAAFLWAMLRFDARRIDKG